VSKIVHSKKRVVIQKKPSPNGRVSTFWGEKQAEGGAKIKGGKRRQGDSRNVPNRFMSAFDRQIRKQYT